MGFSPDIHPAQVWSENSTWDTFCLHIALGVNGCVALDNREMAQGVRCSDPSTHMESPAYAALAGVTALHDWGWGGQTGRSLGYVSPAGLAQTQ